MVVNCSDVVWVVFPTADRTAENEKTVTCTGMTLCLVEQISAFANERGSGGFPESCCGIFGDQMCVETDENDTKSWDDRPAGDTIESTDRMGRRNTIYLENVSPSLTRAKHLLTTSTTDQSAMTKDDWVLKLVIQRAQTVCS